MAQERQQSILIVEDDINLAEMLSAYFTVQGYHALIAEFGETAIISASEAQPDLIILDIHLPDVDGFEVCDRLRASHRTRSIPILFLTEVRDRPDKLHGLELGVVDYITKPFDVQELLLRVRNILRRAASAGIENPVTQLPEGEEVDAMLGRVLAGEWDEAALIAVTLHGVETFRELYGFVASDDVLRVAAVTVAQSALEIAGADAFCGHLDGQTFIVIAPAQAAQPLLARIHRRLDPTLEYFYPGDNRGPNAWSGDRLRLSSGAIHAHETFADGDDLRGRLRAAQEEPNREVI
jgi:DNA-binding response OmpR family regulator